MSAGNTRRSLRETNINTTDRSFPLHFQNSRPQLVWNQPSNKNSTLTFQEIEVQQTSLPHPHQFLSVKIIIIKKYQSFERKKTPMNVKKNGWSFFEISCTTTQSLVDGIGVSDFGGLGATSLPNMFRLLGLFLFDFYFSLGFDQHVLISYGHLYTKSEGCGVQYCSAVKLTGLARKTATGSHGDCGSSTGCRTRIKKKNPFNYYKISNITKFLFLAVNHKSCLDSWNVRVVHNTPTLSPLSCVLQSQGPAGLTHTLYQLPPMW